MTGRCVRCGGRYVRSQDEVACINCGFQVVVPKRAIDRGGDTCPADISDEYRAPRYRVRAPHTGTRALADRSSSADGCFMHPHCLSCPLSRCIYEQTGDLVAGRALAEARKSAIRTMLRTGEMTHEAIAYRLGVSRSLVTKVKRDMGTAVRA
jgi:DNA-directed RNA polymerase subunit RPC12/RpoP